MLSGQKNQVVGTLGCRILSQASTTMADTEFVKWIPKESSTLSIVCAALCTHRHIEDGWMVVECCESPYSRVTWVTGKFSSFVVIAKIKQESPQMHFHGRRLAGWNFFFSSLGPLFVHWLLYENQKNRRCQFAKNNLLCRPRSRPV